jgi:hypothetical protein
MFFAEIATLSAYHATLTKRKDKPLDPEIARHVNFISRGKNDSNDFLFVFPFLLFPSTSDVEFFAAIPPFLVNFKAANSFPKPETTL